MTLNDIKTYLEKRINTSEFLALSDEELEKYMMTSVNLLDTFYYTDQIKDQLKFAMIIGEEMIFLFNSDIDLNLFYRYEGLTSFRIGEGAIQGSVDFKNKGDLFSPYVKSILESLGIEEKIETPGSKVTNSFTWL